MVRLLSACQCMIRHNSWLPAVRFTPREASAARQNGYERTPVNPWRVLKGISIARRTNADGNFKNPWLCSKYFKFETFRSSSTKGCWFAMISWIPTSDTAVLARHGMKVAALDGKRSPPGLLYVEAPPSSALPESPSRQPMDIATCTDNH